MATIAAKSTITIEATPKEVFKYIAELKYYHLWNPSLRAVSSKTKLKLGSEFDTQSVILKDIPIHSHNVVNTYERNKALGLHTNFGNIQYDSRIELTLADNNTIVDVIVNVLTEKQFFGLTLPVLKQLANKELQTDLQALKIAVEQKLGDSLMQPQN